MLDALGCPALPQSRGRSLLPLLRAPETATWEDIAFSEFCLDGAGAGGPTGENGVVQRMVRREDWKLIFYDGQPSQLFNLADDPDELNDLIDSPEHAEIARRLTGMVLDGWDPEWVDAQIREQSANLEILVPWAKNTAPADTVRWQLDPEWDYLDDPQT